MKYNIIQSALLAAALLFPAGLALAAVDKAPAAGETRDLGKARAGDKDVNAKKAKAAAKVKLVDINSAGKKELMTLPGISDADADKIIAGRPYLSKANLTTRNIVARGVYENLKARVIAKQKLDTAGKPGQK